MSGDTELKPCPDGHEAERRPHINGIAGRFLARCSRLDCGWRNVQMTPEQWNRRSTPPGLETVPEGTGYALAMRVLQSSLYDRLDEVERSDCDAILTRPRATQDKETT